MAKAGPDSSTDNHGDFASGGGNITGFSHMHDSETSGVRLISTQTIEYNNSDMIRHSHWGISLSCGGKSNGSSWILGFFA